MKPSMFNVVQMYKGNVLLYNTYSTSMVELKPELYNCIFEQGNMEDYPETEQLLSMGFIVEDDIDEAEEQRQLRECVINNNISNITNIIIAPTLACNANCFYCFEKGYRRGTMNKSTAKAVVHFLKENWNGEKIGITWFGGEPLLAADIIEFLINELNQTGIAFSSKITTNGLLLSKEMLGRIQSKWNVEQIQITIDAIGEEYNKIKNYEEIPDAFSVVIDNIMKALHAGFEIRIRINFDPDKMETAVKTMEYLNKSFGYFQNLQIYFAPIDEDDCVVRNITNSFNDYNEHPFIRLIKYGREHGLYSGFSDMEGDNEMLKFDSYNLLKKLKIYPSPINCYAACPNVFSIDSDGRLYKCHRGLGRIEFSSGNVFTGVEKNSAYYFFSNSNESMDECKECVLLPVCQGGCKINTKLYKGKECCAPSKAIIKELVQLYREDLERKEGDR